MDLAELNLRELKELRKSVDKTLMRRLKENKKAVIAEVDHLVQSRGFTFAELFSPDQATVSRSTKPTKSGRVAYRDPDDPKKTWGGRGRRPEWLVKALDAGRSADEFVVKQEVAATEPVSTDTMTAETPPTDGVPKGAAKAPRAGKPAKAGTNSSTAAPKPAAKKPAAKKAAVKKPATRKSRKPVAEKSDS